MINNFDFLITFLCLVKYNCHKKYFGKPLYPFSLIKCLNIERIHCLIPDGMWNVLAFVLERVIVKNSDFNEPFRYVVYFKNSISSNVGTFI